MSTLEEVLSQIQNGKNHYDILGVPSTAPHEELRKSYFKRSKIIHPDKNQGNAAASEAFKLLAQAYEAIKDPEPRRLYDIKLSMSASINKTTFTNYTHASFNYSRPTQYSAYTPPTYKAAPKTTRAAPQPPPYARPPPQPHPNFSAHQSFHAQAHAYAQQAHAHARAPPAPQQSYYYYPPPPSQQAPPPPSHSTQPPPQPSQPPPTQQSSQSTRSNYFPFSNGVPFFIPTPNNPFPPNEYYKAQQQKQQQEAQAAQAAQQQAMREQLARAQAAQAQAQAAYMRAQQAAKAPPTDTPAKKKKRKHRNDSDDSDDSDDESFTDGIDLSNIMSSSGGRPTRQSKMNAQIKLQMQAEDTHKTKKNAEETHKTKDGGSASRPRKRLTKRSVDEDEFTPEGEKENKDESNVPVTPNFPEESKANHPKTEIKTEPPKTEGGRAPADKGKLNIPDLDLTEDSDVEEIISKKLRKATVVVDPVVPDQNPTTEPKAEPKTPADKKSNTDQKRTVDQKPPANQKSTKGQKTTVQIESDIESESEEEKETEYTVLAVVGKKILPSGRVRYKIRWEGYGSDEDTWEDAKNCANCDAKIREFEEAEKKKENEKKEKQEKGKRERERRKRGETIVIDEKENGKGKKKEDIEVVEVGKGKGKGTKEEEVVEVKGKGVKKEPKTQKEKGKKIEVVEIDDDTPPNGKTPKGGKKSTSKNVKKNEPPDCYIPV
eukprot:Phypoly_transcript_03916.p1 GENE.Phypoly_transcript_03916~~Phypoly_transcript_03916.p1  ORF type:complete len:757 (+),score=209.78 Phypoly_transcript_03916:130-2271(+)